MTLGRIALLAGVALIVLVVNVGLSFVYMVVYGHLINPGHEEKFYKDHIQVAAPYCSIVAGVPLMFLAGWWVGGWWGNELAVTAAMTVWACYAVIDTAIIISTRQPESPNGLSIVSTLRLSHSPGVPERSRANSSKLAWSAGTQRSREATSGGGGLTQPSPRYALAK